MELLKQYKAIFLSGIAVVLFFAAAYAVVWHTEKRNSMTYAEHLFQEDSVNEINIQIDEADWQDMLENPMAEEYHRADVTINGEMVGNVAIRTKGNNTLTSVASSDSDRYSFKLDFDYYEPNGNYYGLKKLCLNNNYGDSSSMREYISYQVMGEMGLAVPGCGYSHITVNGEEWGLYLAVEAVDEVFLQTHFADASGDLYKPDGTGADLVYRGDDISEYTGLNLKTNLKTSDGSAILALMQALESGEGLEEVLDIQSALKYIAANVALANFDSYLGGTTHNYYLYEQDGVFTILPWDYNYAFGGFGGGAVDIDEPANHSMGGGMGGGHKEREEKAERTPENGELPAPSDAEQPQQDEMPMQQQKGRQQFDGKEMPEMPSMGSMGSGEKPLVTTLLENETFRSLYEEYLQEMAETYLTEDYMAALVTKTHDLIAPYIEKDATAFYTYAEFEQACSIDPTDTYSLVYYAVNMAESIQNQLAGGEPTFDVSSLKGGGIGGGKGGMPDFGGEIPDFDGKQPDFGGEMPDFDGKQPDFGGEMPDFDGSGGNLPEMPSGMGGERGRQSVDWKEALPMIAICGGAFAAGAVVLVFFRRKKELKPPKDN